MLQIGFAHLGSGRGGKGGDKLEIVHQLGNQQTGKRNVFLDAENIPKSPVGHAHPQGAVHRQNSRGRIADDFVRKGFGPLFHIGQAHGHIRLALVDGHRLIAAGGIAAGSAVELIRRAVFTQTAKNLVDLLLGGQFGLGSAAGMEGPVQPQSGLGLKIFAPVGSVGDAHAPFQPVAGVGAHFGPAGAGACAAAQLDKAVVQPACFDFV